jgi:hydroxyquinol 1,2-dioxygenase
MSDPIHPTLTENVVRSFAAAPDPRLREVMSALTRHLHAFVREVEPTFEEWMAGVQFLTRTGQICDDVRQEYILLSDTLGVSMLVDAINHRGGSEATESTVLGPFFVADAPKQTQGADLAGDTPGEPLFVDVTVKSEGGRPLAGAVVDVWQSDAEGFYDVQRGGEERHLRGQFNTDGEGRVRFWSILPTAYPIPHDGPVGDLLKATGRHPWRPAHLHFMVGAAGHDTLVTHLFPTGGEYLDSDAVFGVKPSLVRDFPSHDAGLAPDGRKMDGPWRSLNYDFVLPASAA